MLIVGTRGDVQPFVAIGKRLQEYGHRVRLATHSNFKEFFLTAGLEFYPLGGDVFLLNLSLGCVFVIVNLVTSTIKLHLNLYLHTDMVKNKGFLPSGPSEIPVQRSQMKDIIYLLLPACKEPDLDTVIAFRAEAIIANPPAYGHTHVAEALKIPIHIFFTMPWTPTTEFPHPLSRVKQPAGYREIGETKKGVVTTEILNSMISQLSHYSEDTDGFEVFDKFEDFSCETNAQTYYEAIDFFCSPELIGEPVGEGRVRIVCERLISKGKLMDPLYVGSMISSLCEAGMAKEAHSLYLLAKKNKKTPPMEYVKRLFNSLCDGKMIDSDSVCLGLNMLHEIHGGDERKYEIKQFSCVIQALCEVNALEGAKSLLSNLNDDVPPPGNAVYNTIISYVVKSGDTTEAIKIMRIMEDWGLKPDLFTYSEIMSGYIKGGEIQNAVKMFSEAIKNHGNLMLDMYHMVIFVYCRLKKFEKAVKLLEEMEVYAIQPHTDEYDELITSICLKALKASDYGMAERLMAKMAKRGLHLNELRKAVAV